jgi:hypothetical protein
MNQRLFLILLLIGLNSFTQDEKLILNQSTAVRLSSLPLECIHIEYPNKLNQVLVDSSHLQSPRELHPIFYGCFDWHSSVHGHWLLARMMNKFPDSELAAEVVELFDKQFTVPNVQKELAYFQPKLNKSFERTYGWAWVLKLQAELVKSPLNEEHKWSSNLQSLIDEIVGSYKLFLPKLAYPIRVGEHTNTAFGLSLAIDYARVVGDIEFEQVIIERSKAFYSEDVNCPLNWEPSGFDFISPCLQEAELMSKILDKKDYQKWLEEFLPQLLLKDFSLIPGQVIDRTDGKLVHLDGLNFSRAWCLYQIASVLPKHATKLVKIGDEHVLASVEEVIGSNYMGSHWLASFLVYSLEKRSLLYE